MHPCHVSGLLVALTLALPAVADSGIDQSIYAGPMLAAFRYQESEQGERLNREEGNLAGLRIGWQGRTDTLLAGFEFSHLRGEVDYNGQTQAGTPASTITDEQVSRADIRLGRRFQPHQPLSYEVLLILGYRHWQRDIQDAASANGLLETYTGGLAGLGFRARYRFAAAGELHLTGQYSRTFKPEVEVDFGNALDNRSLDLGTAPVIDIALGWTYPLPWDHHFLLQAGYFYENWKFGRSDEEALTRDGVPVGQVFQPGGGSKIHGLVVTLSRKIH